MVEEKYVDCSSSLLSFHEYSGNVSIDLSIYASLIAKKQYKYKHLVKGQLFTS